MVHVLSSISTSQNDIGSIYSWELCPQILVALQEVFWGTVNIITQTVKGQTAVF